MSVIGDEQRKDIWRAIYERRMAELEQKTTEEYDLAVAFLERLERLERHKISLPKSWYRTVKIWRRNGVPYSVLTDLMLEVAGHSEISSYNRWRYYCGCVWKVIKTTQAETEAEAEGASQ